MAASFLVWAPCWSEYYHTHCMSGAPQSVAGSRGVGGRPAACAGSVDVDQEELRSVADPVCVCMCVCTGLRK